VNVLATCDVMAERNGFINSFLIHAGWSDVHQDFLAGDASERRYVRLTRDSGEKCLLMDASRTQDVRPFVLVANYLRNAGYSAPKIIAVDFSSSLLLCEDLGDDLIGTLGNQGHNLTPLYETAVDLLADLQSYEPPSVPVYNQKYLLEEAMHFLVWYMPIVLGRAPSADMYTEFAKIWDSVFSKCCLDDGVLVLRDYHSENLMWLPDRAGLASIGLLDFQDAMIGARAYDLMSLLQDARRDVDPALEEALISRYLVKVGVDPEYFNLAYAILGAQRNTKIIGIFARLARRDQKLRYLDMIPRVWRLLERNLKHPELQNAREWFDRHCPTAIRVIPNVTQHDPVS